MKLKQLIFLGATLSLLTASCDDDLTSRYTVGEENNAIVLGAGIVDGGSGAGVQTRAGGDENHAKHLGFVTNTMIALRVDGTWTGHSPVDVKQKTVATLDVASEEHNPLKSYVPVLFWDDYGMADPANKDTGREQGLTIYGAAVDGKTALLSTLSSLDNTSDKWRSLSWKVGKADETTVMDQSGVDGWSDYDLLTSNNVVYSSTAADDNAFKFVNRDEGKLLEFTHAMTKFTVVLTAGVGFPRTDVDDPTTAHFEQAPTVTLKDFYYTGTVDIEAKNSEPTTSSVAAIKMKLSDGGATYKATFDAMVFPGNTFADAKEILTFTADGNTLSVTAAKLNEAIKKAIDQSSGYPLGSSNLTADPKQYDLSLQQAWNYKLLITVNKTDLKIQATIVDWNEVEAETEAPKINVTATYGYTTTQGGTGVSDFTNNYDLFRSTDKATGYDEDDAVDGINPAACYTSSAWDKTIYWPDHQTHYFFRGVYPQVGTDVSGTSAIGAEALTTENGNDVVAVANATYTTETYPSDLAIAIPRKTDGSFDETCKVTGHTATEGICATEGVIYMNFEYAMSKVEVRLKSSATDESHLELTKDNTKVEIIGGYNKARIKLSDGLHDTYADADKGAYTLSNLETPVTDFLVTTRDAVVPQVISDDVIFRITVITGDNGTPTDPSDDPIDVYECKVNLINVKNSSPATPVTEWEHGKHYIYELDVNKTAVTIVATLKDWVTVTASDQVWF